MTKKDYIRIVEDLAVAVNKAVALHDATPTEARTMAIHFASAFADTEEQQNPRFDRIKFFSAVTTATGSDPIGQYDRQRLGGK